MAAVPGILELPRNDTIVAISTPPGRGALGIIRLSGSDAINISSALLHTKIDLKSLRGGSARVSTIDTGDGLIDTGVVTVWRAPKSFTGEDIVEFTLHGSPPLLSAVENRAVELGARPASPGEFTLRAILHGKMTLSEAGAISALIEAPGIVAAKAAARTLGGDYGRRITPIIEKLEEIELQTAAETEFPEQIERDNLGTIATKLTGIKTVVETLARDIRQGHSSVREAVVVVAGLPNVGKSTLTNALLGRERCIVHSEPGTTRDLIEERCDFDGIAAILVDTAGLRETDDGVELIGVDMAHKRLADADLVIFVIDASRELSSEEVAALSKTDDKKRIIVLNKSDIGGRRDPGIPISALEGTGIESLREEIARALSSEDGDPIWAGSWQIERIDDAIESVESAIYATGIGAIDAAIEEIAHTSKSLSESIGKNPAADIIERVLDGFCIGK